MFVCFFGGGLHNKLVLLVGLRGLVHNNNKSQPTWKMAMFLPEVNIHPVMNATIRLE
jgi:hypothetical protein